MIGTAFLLPLKISNYSQILYWKMMPNNVTKKFDNIYWADPKRLLIWANFDLSVSSLTPSLTPIKSYFSGYGWGILQKGRGRKSTCWSYFFFWSVCHCITLTVPGPHDCSTTHRNHPSQQWMARHTDAWLLAPPNDFFPVPSYGKKAP